MSAAFTTLKLTDGTTTADLVDGVNFALAESGWAPAVAPKRRSQLAGGGPYEDVAERIMVNVFGATGAQALANLATLSQLLDQAEAWQQGHPVPPVRLLCQPQGSLEDAPLATVVLGRARDDELLQLPTTFNDDLRIYEIAQVELRFLRRGEWLGAADQGFVVNSVDNPGVMEATFAAEGYGPVRLNLGGFQIGSDNQLPASALLVAESAERLGLVEAEAMATGGAFTNIADSSASGGAVLRYTYNALNALLTTSGSASLGGLHDSARRIGVFANIQNKAAGTSWEVRAVLLNGNFGLAPHRTPGRVVDGTTCQWRYLGAVAAAFPLDAIQIEVKRVAGTGTQLDIDALALIDLDDETSRVVEIGAGEFLGLFPPATIYELSIDHAALSLPAPRVVVADDATETAIPTGWRGDPWLLSRGSSLAAMWLATGGNTWRYRHASNAVAATVINATRRRSSLVPQ